MKIRQGFVSNSSSSSFMIMVSKKMFDELYDTLHGLEKAVVDSFSVSGTIGTLEVKGLSYGIDLNGDGTEYQVEDITSSYMAKHPDEDYSKFNEEDEYGDEYKGTSILNTIGDKLAAICKKNGDGYVSHTEGNG